MDITNTPAVRGQWDSWGRVGLEDGPALTTWPQRACSGGSPAALSLPALHELSVAKANPTDSQGRSFLTGKTRVLFQI